MTHGGVLATFYGDNYFWLLPGKNRTIIVDPRRPIEHPWLRVEAGGGS